MEYKNTYEKEYSTTTNKEHLHHLGQFFTPYYIAHLLAEWITSVSKSDLTALDPSAGFGVLPRAIEATKDRLCKIYYDLYEIDTNISPSLSQISKNDLNIENTIFNEDFLLSPWDKKYDIIIANPPYLKHQKIANRKIIQASFHEKTNRQFSTALNLYSWFLIKSLFQLKEWGRIAFIIPKEFLNNNSNVLVRELLLTQNMNWHILSIKSKNRIFSEVLTTSILLLGEKTNTKGKVAFYSVELTNTKTRLRDIMQSPINIIDNNKIDPKIKWSNYLQKETNNNNMVPISLFGKFIRGIATGSNHFFLINTETANKYNLQENALIPCVGKARFVKGKIFNQDALNELILNNKNVYLFNGNKDTTNYLKVGENLKIPEKYLNKHRNPWYLQEKREPSKIWISVFTRKDFFKVCWNSTEAITLTAFHNFRPNSGFDDYQKILFLYLQTEIGQKNISLEVRDYANNLRKLEPNDLNQSYVYDFRKLQTAEKILLYKYFDIFLNHPEKEKEIINKVNFLFLELIRGKHITTTIELL